MRQSWRELGTLSVLRSWDENTNVARSMWLWSQVMGQCQPGSCHQAGHCHSHRNMCGDILEHDPCWRTCDMEKQELLPTLLDLVLEFHEWWSIAAYARNDNVLPHNTVGCCGVASVAWYSIILVHGNSLGSWDGTPLSFSNSYITLLLMWTTVCLMQENVKPADLTEGWAEMYLLEQLPAEIWSAW